MKLSASIISCTLLLSCTLKQEFEKISKIRSDLQTVFNHDEINTSSHSGTDPDDEKITVTFYHFNLDSLSYQELTSLATRVGNRICDRNLDLRNSALIEVNFTKATDPEQANGLVTFKLRNPCQK